MCREVGTQGAWRRQGRVRLGASAEAEEVSRGGQQNGSPASKEESSLRSGAGVAAHVGPSRQGRRWNVNPGKWEAAKGLSQENSRGPNVLGQDPHAGRLLRCFPQPFSPRASSPPLLLLSSAVPFRTRVSSTLHGPCALGASPSPGSPCSHPPLTPVTVPPQPSCPLNGTRVSGAVTQGRGVMVTMSAQPVQGKGLSTPTALAGVVGTVRSRGCREGPQISV